MLNPILNYPFLQDPLSSAAEPYLKKLTALILQFSCIHEDLSLRLRDHGPLMYCHRAQIMHLSGHGSPRKPEVAAFKAYHSTRSRVYILA